MEGAIRINRFFSGVDLHSVEQSRFSWKDRLVELLVGLALLLPFVNSIVWLAMQMFNHTKPLSNELGAIEEEDDVSDPYSSESEMGEDEVPAPIESSEPTVEETFETVDYVNEKGTENIVRTIRSKWIVQKQGTKTTYFKDDEDEKTVSEYDQGVLVKFDCFWKSTNIHTVVHKHHDHLSFTGTRGGKAAAHKRCELQGRTWIQQQTVGFAPFLNSESDKYPYVMVNPFYFSVLKHKVPSLEEMVAERTKTDEGSTVKLIVQGAAVWVARKWEGSDRFDAKFYFDREGKFTAAKYITVKIAGELLSGTHDVKSEIVKSADPSPESERQ